MEEGDDLALTGGARASALGERRQRYPFGFARCWASGRFFGWAESVPAAFYSFSKIFWFSFSYFLFLSFARMLQIISNFFLKFSRNQHIVLSHPVTCFQNKNRVLCKTS
jgi:hypothetical protein